MGFFLVGGGPDTLATAAVHDEFLAEACTSAGWDALRITGSCTTTDHQRSAAHFLPDDGDPLEGRSVVVVGRVCVRPAGVRPGEEVDPSESRGVDAIVVGGGPRPPTSRVCDSPPRASAVRLRGPCLVWGSRRETWSRPARR